MGEQSIEGRITRPDGRVVAWSEQGPADGLPVLRSVGTPGSRVSRPPDWAPWAEQNIRLIATERPGFGASTRLPGRGFNEHADDLAAILDHLGLDRAPMLAISGGAPHLLAFAARHPDRLSAGTIVGGAAPMAKEDLDPLIPINRRLFDVIEASDHDGVVEVLTPFFNEIQADPLWAVATAMLDANDTDRDRVVERSFQRRWILMMADALQSGIEGWADESLAFGHGWDDIDFAAISCSIRWFHAPDDRLAPISAAKRLLRRLPEIDLIEFAPDEGAHYSAQQDVMLLNDLLGRAGLVSTH